MPNIRFVLHYDLPQNIESYYQQIGRAGRDGLNAQCLLLFSYGDIHKLKYFINQKEGDELKAARQNLRAMVSYAESFECRRIPLLKYFGEKCDTRKCGMCDNCLSGSSESVDLTVPAQKFLSCVKRTGEKYGSEYIIDVLRGSEARKIIENGHNSLSTYNIGREYSKKQWLYLARQLLQKELMEQDMETGSLKITERTWDVFRGKEYVFGRMIDARADSVDESEKIQREIQAKAETEVEGQNYDIRLFDLLKKKRKELADMNAIPPYAVFPDRTLIEMSVFYPGTRYEMMMLHGVGLVKYEKYGEVFIDTISAYCRENNIENRPEKKPDRNMDNGLINNGFRNNNVTRNSVNINTERKSARLPRKRELFAGDYNSGISLKEIIRKYDTDIRNVSEHLTKYIMDGKTLRDSDEFLDYSELSDEQVDLVMNAFAEIGHERLRPVYEALGEEISFDELKLMRLHYIVNDGQNTGNRMY
jgi:ATP-dependent DNA helicase RecQ